MLVATAPALRNGDREKPARIASTRAAEAGWRGRQDRRLREGEVAGAGPDPAGRPEKATHDYIRHGTTTLFAALEIATGQVADACYPRAIATVADAPASSARTACLHAQPACLPPQQSWQATVIVT
jgi:hypothetical protein